MAYLKKNVNMFLLLLFVIIIGGVAGLTTFYQTTYKDLSLNYEDQVAEIEKLLTDLNAERAKLNQTALQLDVKEEREANEFREKAASYKANYDRCQRQLSELQNPQP